MKFLTDFAYRNLHGFTRFPGDNTALVEVEVADKLLPDKHRPIVYRVINCVSCQCYCTPCTREIVATTIYAKIITAIVAVVAEIGYSLRPCMQYADLQI